MTNTTGYQGVVRVLRQRLAEGVYPPGGRLPSQSALARELAVDRNQIRRAQAWMIERGELDSAQGLGVWAPAGTFDYAIHAGTRFGPQLRAAGYQTHTVFRDARSIVPPHNVLSLIEMKPGSRAIRVDLTRIVDGLPAMLANHYYNPARTPRIAALIAETGSVTASLARLGLELRRGVTSIRSRLASRAEARALGIAPSQSVVEITGCNVDEAGDPLEVSVAIARSDRIRLYVPAETTGAGKAQ
ncbi:GntR family transcriptional regulator [Paracoccus sp. S-4012]|uniref:GntR family transcriptional regulator n=1 Tax=Paracoccus sp. S-4012 TaxID=2665648 RepID=UPI0018A1E57B|nr:GntR family transcriptional regulator [Paracoccus sp. S-4012]